MKDNDVMDSMLDTLIGLAASKYVETEGKKILEEAEQLNQIEIEKLTEDQKKEFEKLCKRELRNNKRKMKNYKISFYRVAAVVAIILIAFNISIVSVPAMRQAAVGFLTKTYDTHTDIEQYSDEKPEPVENISDSRFGIVLDREYAITYLPEGFQILTFTKDKNGWRADYSNDNGVISFSQVPVEGASMGVDTEEAETKNIIIDGNKALVVVKEKDKQVMVSWRVENCFLTIMGADVSEVEVIKVAKSVRKVR